MAKIFGSKELINCVENLDCKYNSSKSSHIKYNLPEGHKLPKGERPFYIIQVSRKTYAKHICNRYITELKMKGFTKKQIDKAFSTKK
mgnify:CR=1 FL=1